MGSGTTAARIVARVMLALGFLAAGLSYASWSATRTALDPQATRAASHELLHAPAVQRSITETLEKQLAEQLHAAGTADTKVGQAVTAALSDPRFVEAFADAIASLHEQLLANTGGKVTIDTGPVTAAVHDALAKTDPVLAAQVQTSKPLEVDLGDAKLPKLGDVREHARTIWVTGALIALVLITGALLLDPRRKSIGRAGRRTAYLAISPMLAFVVVPAVLAHLRGDVPTTIAPVLRVYGHRVVPSAIALVVLGVSVWLTTLVWPWLRRAGTAPGGSRGRWPGEDLPDFRAPASAPPRVPERLYL